MNFLGIFKEPIHYTCKPMRLAGASL